MIEGEQASSELAELPAGRKIVLVIYTRGIADDKTLLPAITKRLLGELAPVAPPAC